MLVGGKADGFPEKSIPVTFETFFMTTFKVISIKQTREIKENRRYLIVIKDVDYEVSTTHLKRLFTVFKKNPDDEKAKQ